MADKKKVTAASVVVKELSKKRIPSDDEIIKAVKKAVKGSNFDNKQLAWYKTRARTGKSPFTKKIAVPKAKAVPKTKKTTKKKKKKAKAGK